MGIRVVSPPSGYPVSLDEVKDWLREDSSEQDVQISLLLAAMTRYAEAYTGRVFVERTLQLNLDEFPLGEIVLPHPPVQSVSSIIYTDSDGAAQTLSTADYEVDTISEPARIRPVFDVFWPATDDVYNAVRITFVCGYPGGSPDMIPHELRVWLQARIGTLYENREQIIVGSSVATIPRTFADGLLDGLMVGTRLFR